MSSSRYSSLVPYFCWDHYVYDVHMYICTICIYAVLKDLSKDGLYSPELAAVDEPKVSILFVCV